MDFGKAENIDNIDLSLPEDHLSTKKILQKFNTEKKNQKIFIGCAKWGRKDWIGKIYPNGAKEANFLDYYVQHFNSIELNATHYRMPDSVTTLKWANKAGSEFRFCPKFPQLITHIKRLKNAEELTTSFFKGIEPMAMQDKLGACFLQLPPNFGPKNMEVFEEYVKSLPSDIPVCVEFRHPDWFINPFFDQAFEILEKYELGAVITDAAGRRDVIHQRLTNNIAFIRFVGNNLHPTDYSRIDEWAERIKKWLSEGAETIYFFMHQHDEQYTPELIKYAIETVNKKCDIELQPLKLLNEN